MYRVILHRHHLPRTPRSLVPKHRKFASTVLLSRTWEHETVVTLRQEAKIRGLSTKGNKSSLVSRIREFEEARAALFSQHVELETPAASRSVSSSATAPQTMSSGVPPASQRVGPSVNPGFFSVRVPDLSGEEPDAPVQAPFLPDFWDSSSSSLRPEAAEPSHPKFLVVSGSATHPDGGPTYNLEKPREVEGVEVTVSEAHAEPLNKHGFFRDLADDLGLSPASRVGSAVSDVVRVSKARGSDIHLKSRPLNGEERKGVWVLLGLLAGSWIVGGWINRTPPTHKEHDMEGDKH